ncbi:uncharacterized protein sS8_0285 [Methylocaldum marinum]|uniref:Uncharacterized protein n=1 Tax=Methylocaldum marinum TaxID=1432792 RepID=A0A286P3N1_9GAMM|nr:uncharacterized protein sS8_0285 [Methylocaldum marinum]
MRFPAAATSALYCAPVCRIGSLVPELAFFGARVLPIANGAFGSAEVALPIANGAFGSAEVALPIANGAFGSAEVALPIANGAFNRRRRIGYVQLPLVEKS